MDPYLAKLVGRPVARRPRLKADARVQTTTPSNVLKFDPTKRVPRGDEPPRTPRATLRKEVVTGASGVTKYTLGTRSFYLTNKPLTEIQRALLIYDTDVLRSQMQREEEPRVYGERR